MRIAVAEPDVLRGFKDDLLRFFFACCYPALEDGESAVMTLAAALLWGDAIVAWYLDGFQP